MSFFSSFKKPFSHRLGGMMVLALLVLAMLLPEIALASGVGGALPFEGNLKTLTDSLTGPVAFGISIVGIVAAGAILIFGGELSGFLRTIVFLVLVISIVVNAASIVQGLGGSANGTSSIEHAHAGQASQIS